MTTVRPDVEDGLITKQKTWSLFARCCRDNWKCICLIGLPGTARLGIGCARGLRVDKVEFDDSDHSAVVKNRWVPPQPWRWEIYRVGKSNPIGWSPIFFRTLAAANTAGKAALKQLFAERRRSDCSCEDQRETLRFSAEVLPLLATSSYSTTWPSLRPLRPALSTAEIWTNTSFPPPCGA